MHRKSSNMQQEKALDVCEAHSLRTESSTQKASQIRVVISNIFSQEKEKNEMMPRIEKKLQRKPTKTYLASIDNGKILTHPI